MSNDKDRVTKYSGIGAQVEIKKRDPGARPTTAPGRLMEFTAEANEFQNEIDALKLKLAEAEQGGEHLVPMDKVYEVEGRRRYKSSEDYASLKENLSKNAMIVPISVIKRPDGRYEIISGHNRAAAWRELGNTEISVHIVDAKEEDADKAAFYANLMQESLTPFEKYQRFKAIMEEKGMTAKQMSEDSGIKEDTINGYLSFNRLPKEAIEILRLNPECVGVNAAEDFAKIADKGRVEQVIKAIEQLSKDKTLTQSNAVKMAAADPIEAKAKKPTPTIVKFKIGKSNFAQVRGIEKDIRISCENIEDRAELQSKIEALIQAHIDEKKS